MTIRKKLSMGIGVLMVLFLALGVISYFQIVQIDDGLSEVIQGKVLGKRAVLLHRLCKTLDATLAKTRDARSVLLSEAAEAIHSLEVGMAAESPVSTDTHRQGEQGWTTQFARLSIDIDEIVKLLVSCPKVSSEESEEQIPNAAEAVERKLRLLGDLASTKWQRDMLSRIENQFRHALSLHKRIFVLDRRIGDKTAELEKLKAELDGLLGGDFEVFSRADLERAGRAGHRMVRTKVLVILVLILTGSLDVLVFGAITTRSITKPLVRLKNATTEIGEGKFDTKITVESNDEIGQLAMAFKHMAQQRKLAEDGLREARDELEVRVEKRTAELVRANEVLESEIREREKAELALEQLNRDLETSVRDLMRSNKELQEFSYIAAHDLKTPLRGIATLAEWISNDHADKLGEDGREQVSLLLARTKQMDALVDGVLQFSSIRQCERKRHEIDLNVVLSETTAEMNVPEQVQIRIDSRLPVLICEKGHMRKLFRKLLDNAIEHGARKDVQIKIGCVKQADCWKFSVCDNGPGIDDRYFEKIFRIFQTLSPREQTRNTGIGLAIVKKIVELNAGSVWVESEVGKGSTFYFTLPTHIAAPHAQSQGGHIPC